MYNVLNFLMSSIYWYHSWNSRQNHCFRILENIHFISHSIYVVKFDLIRLESFICLIHPSNSTYIIKSVNHKFYENSNSFLRGCGFNVFIIQTWKACINRHVQDIKWTQMLHLMLHPHVSVECTSHFRVDLQTNTIAIGPFFWSI